VRRTGSRNCTVSEDAVAQHRNHVSPTLRLAIEMISIKRESDEENRRWFLPGQAEGGESRDFHLSTFLDADFSQLLAEIGRIVAGAKESQDLIATCTERHTRE
jgi:hypothetical protein